MQIHELNNFTGTLGSGAYLAVDDGNDTGKLSTQQLLAATEARIDNIIAGPAPSAEEIVDARLGDDGVTYPSLGDAIRDQVGDLKSEYGENTLNIWESDSEYTFTQMKQFLLGTPLPAGTYTVIADVVSDATNSQVSRVRFADSGGTLGTIDLPRKKNAIGYATISSPCPIIQLYSSDNNSHSSGYTATFSNIRLFSGKQTPLPYKAYIADVSANDQYARNMIDRIRMDNMANLCALAFKYVAADGTLTDNNGLRTSDYIPIDKSFNTLLLSNIVTVSGVAYKIRPVAVFFDANKALVGVVSSGALNVIEAPIPSTATYVRINQSIDETESFCYGLYKKEIYEVGADKEYTSLTDCLLALKDNSSEKTIRVYGGTYDIFEEYRNANVPRPSESEDLNNWIPYNVLVPENTHLVGIGDVVLQYTPEASDTYATESKMVSPLNLAGSCTIENITVIGKNCRYCIHDDTMGLKRYANSQKTFKRVKTIKQESDTGLGYRTTNGCGIDGNAEYHFEDCDFNGVSRGWYCHTRISNESGTAYTLAESITLSFKNCTFSASDNGALTLANVGTSQRKVNVLLDNCFIDGGIISGDDSDISLGTKPNAYAIRMMNCNNTSITIRDASNIYTPIVLNTIGA